MFASLSAFDTQAIHAVQSIGPLWLGVAWFLSALVGYSGLVLTVVIIALVMIGKKRVAIETFLIYVASLLATYGLKALIQALRPFQIDPSVIPYVHEVGFGMPSGHALMSCAVLGWVWLRHPKSRIMLWGVPMLLVFIGLSRIYLGVHYPSQVVAGWIAGLLLIWIFSWVDRRATSR